MKLTSVFQYGFGTICVRGSFHRTLSWQWRFQHSLPENISINLISSHIITTTLLNYPATTKRKSQMVQANSLHLHKRCAKAVDQNSDRICTLTESIPSSSLMSPTVLKTHISPSTEADTNFSFLLGWKRT